MCVALAIGYPRSKCRKRSCRSSASASRSPMERSPSGPGRRTNRSWPRFTGGERGAGRRGLPEIAENRLIARHDNSVLAVQLLACPAARGLRRVLSRFDDPRESVVVVHPRGYSATTLCLVTLIGLWIWRQAVFLGPPLAPRPQSRRSIGEYVDAMARFLNRGDRARRSCCARFARVICWGSATSCTCALARPR